MAKTKQQNQEPAELPCEPDVEKSLLGLFMLSPDRLYEATAIGLRPEHFHFDWNRKIFIAMSELQESGVGADILTVAHYLEGQGTLGASGDVAYISGLMEGVPDRANPEWHVQVLKESRLRRELFRMGGRLTEMAADPTDPIKHTLAGAHDDLLALQGDAQESSVVSLPDVAAAVIGKIETSMSADPYRTIGIPFGIAELDEVTSGMREAQFCVVAGWPKSGKTSFAIDTVRKIVRAEEGAVPIGFFSLEMRKEELWERILSQESQIPYAKIRKPMNLAISEFRELQRITAGVPSWPLHIDDTAKHIHEIIPRAHLMLRKHKAKLIVVDFLQRIKAPGDKEYEQVSYSANALTEFSKSTGVPVLALSQLTRPEGRKGDPNVTPTVGMLRSSGLIEQNAHVIVLIHHPMDKDTGNPSGEDVLIVGAQRAGPTGRCKAYFDVKTQRWEERGAQPEPVPQQNEIFQTQGEK